MNNNAELLKTYQVCNGRHCSRSFFVDQLIASFNTEAEAKEYIVEEFFDGEEPRWALSTGACVHQLVANIVTADGKLRADFKKKQQIFIQTKSCGWYNIGDVVEYKKTIKIGDLILNRKLLGTCIAFRMDKQELYSGFYAQFDFETELFGEKFVFTLGLGNHWSGPNATFEKQKYEFDCF